MKLKQLIAMTMLIGLAVLTGCNSKEESKTKEKAKFDISKAGDKYLKAIEKGVYYEELITTQDGTTVSQVWMKGEKLKRVTPSQNAAMIINEDQIISYDLVTKQGFIMNNQEEDGEEVDEEEDMEPENYYNEMSEEMVDAMSEEVYNGQKCMVTQMTAEGSTMKIWFNKKTGFFVRFEMLSEGSLISAVEYSDVKFNGIDDSDFEVPADVVITDMNSIMDEMEGNMDALMEGLGDGLF